jgi:hypothetical protein
VGPVWQPSVQSGMYALPVLGEWRRNPAAPLKPAHARVVPSHQSVSSVIESENVPASLEMAETR